MSTKEKLRRGYGCEREEGILKIIGWEIRI
jgi:hypothetical protein